MTALEKPNFKDLILYDLMTIAGQRGLYTLAFKNDDGTFIAMNTQGDFQILTKELYEDPNTQYVPDGIVV